ncbi:MAG: divergent polysaccharide deacetylase family protein [Gammaproteobacteria bacterium]
MLVLVLAAPLAHAGPVISIIIDDLGEHLALGQRAIELPGVMTYAVLPYATHTRLLAQQAHARHKQVMLHQPMAAQSERKLGRGALQADTSAEQLEQILAANLAAVPHAEGINNHMGSLLTAQETMMATFMHAVARRGNLFFIDSRTTSASVALQQARENGIASTTRDVFLDNSKSIEAIHQQIDTLIARAQRKGHALAIGHPYRETLEALEARLPLLQAQGIQMVRASDYILHKYKEKLTWQTSLSPSPRVVKN